MSNASKNRLLTRNVNANTKPNTVSIPIPDMAGIQIVEKGLTSNGIVFKWWPNAGHKMSVTQMSLGI